MFIDFCISEFFVHILIKYKLINYSSGSYWVTLFLYINLKYD